MNPTTERRPLYFEVLYSRGRGDRWRRMGRAVTAAEASSLCFKHSGDWHVKPVYPLDRADGPSLFDTDTDADPTAEGAV